jgi:hypothetical protein
VRVGRRALGMASNSIKGGRMVRNIYHVKLARREQMLEVPVELLMISSECNDEADSGCLLLYRDLLTAFKVAAASGGTVVPGQP